MLTIWKFQLEVTDEQPINMPNGAQILSIQVQHEKPYIWAMVDPDAEKKNSTIQIFGTGLPVTNPGIFIGTFQVSGGSLVFHAFIK